MSNEIIFIDNSDDIKNLLEEKVIAAIYETAGEIESAAKRNTRIGKVNGGKTKEGWGYNVDEGSLTAYIGNTQENAIWEEFGTGEYALEGKGRSGGWYIMIGEGEGQIPEKVAKAYKMKIYCGKDGKRFVHTYGKKPSKALQRAYIKNKHALKKALEYHLKN